MKSNDNFVTELIEINLLFAQSELSLGRDGDVAKLRALDHIREALQLMHQEMVGRMPNIPRAC